MKRPNILFIMADQMAAPILPLHDAASPIQMPNLMRLAAEAVVFDAAYCNSPLCAPSRFTLVSGQLPSKIGAYDNAADFPADVPTYAHYLRRLGYRTALSGKMHFCGPDQLHGYEERLTSDIYPADYGWAVNWDEPDVRPTWYHNMSSVLQAGPCVRTNQLDFDEEVVFKAQQYLFDHIREDGDQPFCLTVSMTHPHDPYTIPKPFWDLYDDNDIPLPATPNQEDLDPQDRDFDRRFMRDHRGKAFQRLTRRFFHARDADQFDMGVEADEHRRQTDEAVHRRHQLRHLGHLHPLRDHIADPAAKADHDQACKPVARARPHQGRDNRKAHADNAVPDRALGAFLPRKAAQRLDEEDRRDHIGRRRESVFHCSRPPLTISGTWQACAG